MSSDPLFLPVPELARRLYEAIPETERPSLTVIDFQKQIERTQFQGGLNLPRDSFSDAGSISRFEAYRFLEDTYSNKLPRSSFRDAFLTYLPKIFFSTVPLDGQTHRYRIQNGEIPSKIPVTLESCSDGDTCRLRFEGEDTRSIRLAGVDTPESFISTKFVSQLFALLNHWKNQGWFTSNELPSQSEIRTHLSRSRPPTKSLAELNATFRNYPAVTLLARHIAYNGHIASLVNKDFADFVRSQGYRFYHEESYNRRLDAGEDLKLCDMTNVYDTYGRRLSILHASAGAIDTYLKDRLKGLSQSGGEDQMALRELKNG